MGPSAGMRVQPQTPQSPAECPPSVSQPKRNSPVPTRMRNKEKVPQRSHTSDMQIKAPNLTNTCSQVAAVLISSLNVQADRCNFEVPLVLSQGHELHSHYLIKDFTTCIISWTALQASSLLAAIVTSFLAAGPLARTTRAGKSVL